MSDEYPQDYNLTPWDNIYPSSAGPVELDQPDVDTAIDDDIQEVPRETEYAGVEALTSYIPGHDEPQSFMDDHPGKFLTQVDGESYVSANYRPLPVNGGLTNIGKDSLITSVNITETIGGGAIRIRLRDGIDVGSPAMWSGFVPAFGTVTVNFITPIYITRALYIELVGAASFEGYAYIKQEKIR